MAKRGRKPNLQVTMLEALNYMLHKNVAISQDKTTFFRLVRDGENEVVQEFTIEDSSPQLVTSAMNLKEFMSKYIGERRDELTSKQWKLFSVAMMANEIHSLSEI